MSCEGPESIFLQTMLWEHVAFQSRENLRNFFKPAFLLCLSLL